MITARRTDSEVCTQVFSIDGHATQVILAFREDAFSLYGSFFRRRDFTYLVVLAFKPGQGFVGCFSQSLDCTFESRYVSKQ